MKRMVLIPEERLLRYEERDKQRAEHRGDIMGQVLLDGVLIPKSNISDLVSDAMRPRKHFNPVVYGNFITY